MLQLTARRLLFLIPTLFIVTFGVFLLITLVPGDPATTLAGGENASPARIEAVREELGLNDPFFVQYGRYITGAARLDFGESLLSGKSVMSEITNRLPVTLSIVGAAILVGLILGIPAGLLAGAKPDGRMDRFILALSSLGLAIPNFVLAILLSNYLAIELGWFDAIGFTRLTSEDGLQVGDWLKSLFMPAVALGVGIAARLARQVRAGVLDTFSEPYIRTAWAKGCRPQSVIAKHVFKNAAMPTVTVAGLLIGGMLGGTVIVENIFATPGIGDYLVRAIISNDLPVIQGVAVMFVLAFAIINLAVDLIYGYLNPKVQVA